MYLRVLLVIAALTAVVHGAGISESKVTVQIDPAVKYQVIEGYGHGNMEQKTPVWYAMYDAKQRESILDDLYTLKDGGLGLNIYRYPMPAGDDPSHNHMRRLPAAANKPFEYADGKFNFDGHEDVLWMGTGAAKRGAKLWASWYGVPYWLSTSGCSAGSVDGKTGNLIAGKEERFVKHIIDIMNHFRDELGIDFDYINPINEPEADWWKVGGGQPGCHVSAEQAIILFSQLCKALKANSYDPKVIAYDAAFTNTVDYLKKLIDSEIADSVDILSCHQYITTEKGLKGWASIAKANDKGLWMSEWGDWTNTKKTPKSNIKQMLNYATKLHEAFDVLNANAWIMWEVGFIFDTEKSGLEKRKSYWATAHYTRHVRPGAVRISAKCGVDEIKTTAWLVGDNGKGPGRLVLVTVNNGLFGRNVEYDLSAFKSPSILEVRRTSSDDDYKLLPKPEVHDCSLILKVLERSVTTIEFEIK